MAYNRLLSVIPADVRERLEAHAKTVELSHGQIVHYPGQQIESVYFPITSLISVTIKMASGNTTEVGLVGSREMVGVNAFMGGSETNDTEYVAQIPGTAVRVPADLLLSEFDRNSVFRRLLLRYTQAYIAQISQNVACNRQHDLRQRLARWLLETQDRLQSNDVPLTHEFISEMLGVRRQGITEAMGEFQQNEIINCGRGTITILDPERLHSASCECFKVLCDEYDRLLGPRHDPRH
jgi:CRP-like cAMP-binding protein